MYQFALLKHPSLGKMRRSFCMTRLLVCSSSILLIFFFSRYSFLWPFIMTPVTSLTNRKRLGMKFPELLIIPKNVCDSLAQFRVENNLTTSHSLCTRLISFANYPKTTSNCFQRSLSIWRISNIPPRLIQKTTNFERILAIKQRY